MKNQCPIVLVHGIFGYGSEEMLGFSYWGEAKKADCELPLHEASVGPISSHHDRACELYAQIKGTQVDYGKEHSKQAGHHQLGKDYRNKGFYPEWSEVNPIHLVGHSMGGPTIRMLQYLLSTQFFDPNTSEKWIKSVSGISAVFNGSTLPYMLGCDKKTGKVSGKLGNTLAKVIKLSAGVVGSNLEHLYDFDLNHWGLTKKPDENLTDYLDRIDDSQLFKGEDNAAYDLTIQALLKQNGFIQTFPETYYFSYVTEHTSPVPLFKYQRPTVGINLLFVTTSAYMGMNPFFPNFYDGFNIDDWRENDGAVSSYSQMYPRIAGEHPVGGEFSDSDREFQTGRWYWQYLHDQDHLNVVMLPKPLLLDWQRNFYSDLFKRLADLP